MKLSYFKQDLFTRIRNLARGQRPDHPWLEMDDKELMRSTGLYKKDYQTGESGYTLAAVLLLGKDDVIQNILPWYKTDAILRVENINRYDDRDEIQINLVESYDRLMAFVRKHLSDKFYQEGGQRISLRDRIFREVVVNLLVHREFTNAYPAKFIIEADRIRTENWNRPHGNGRIDPEQFSPYPKNIVITKFFKELGRVDELGSGVRNVFRYTSLYSEGTPAFIEADIFKMNIPVNMKDRLSSDETKDKFGEDYKIN